MAYIDDLCLMSRLFISACCTPQWQTTGIPMRYGTGIDWNEFHTPTECHGAPD